MNTFKSYYKLLIRIVLGIAIIQKYRISVWGGSLVEIVCRNVNGIKTPRADRWSMRDTSAENGRDCLSVENGAYSSCSKHPYLFAPSNNVILYMSITVHSAAPYITQRFIYVKMFCGLVDFRLLRYKGENPALHLVQKFILFVNKYYHRVDK